RSSRPPASFEPRRPWRGRDVSHPEAPTLGAPGSGGRAPCLSAVAVGGIDLRQHTEGAAREAPSSRGGTVASTEPVDHRRISDAGRGIRNPDRLGTVSERGKDPSVHRGGPATPHRGSP